MCVRLCQRLGGICFLHGDKRRTMTEWKSRRGCGEDQRTAAPSQAILSNVHHVDLIATTAWTSWPELQCLLPLPKLFHRCSWIRSCYRTKWLLKQCWQPNAHYIHAQTSKRNCVYRRICSVTGPFIKKNCDWKWDAKSLWRIRHKLSVHNYGTFLRCFMWAIFICAFQDFQVIICIFIWNYKEHYALLSCNAMLDHILDWSLFFFFCQNSSSPMSHFSHCIHSI